MLKKQNRLSRITNTSKGRFYTSPFFDIKIYEGGEKATRFGFVVSKKVSAKAVTRNRTKRVLRDVCQSLLEKINSAKDIVVFSKKELNFKQKEDILKNMTEIFSKAKII